MTFALNNDSIMNSFKERLYDDLSKDKKEVFNEIFSKGIVSSELVVNFELLKPLSCSEAISIGYLTIDEYGPLGYAYKVPNEVIERLVFILKIHYRKMVLK